MSQPDPYEDHPGQAPKRAVKLYMAGFLAAAVVILLFTGSLYESFHSKTKHAEPTIKNHAPSPKFASVPAKSTSFIEPTPARVVGTALEAPLLFIRSFWISHKPATVALLIGAFFLTAIAVGLAVYFNQHHANEIGGLGAEGQEPKSLWRDISRADAIAITASVYGVALMLAVQFLVVGVMMRIPSFLESPLHFFFILLASLLTLQVFFLTLFLLFAFLANRSERLCRGLRARSLGMVAALSIKSVFHLLCIAVSLPLLPMMLMMWLVGRGGNLRLYVRRLLGSEWSYYKCYFNDRDRCGCQLGRGCRCYKEFNINSLYFKGCKIASSWACS